MYLDRICRSCEEETRIEVTEYSHLVWGRGAPIQTAMPYLTDDQRELILSNICGSCYAREHGYDDDLEIAKANADDDEVVLRRTCKNCRSCISVLGQKVEFLNWKNGEPIETALPDHDEYQRDTLISSHCEDCLESLYEELSEFPEQG